LQWLGWMSVVVSLNNVGSLLFYSRYVFLAPHLAHLHSPLMFLFFPCYWFYVQKSIVPSWRLQYRGDAWHFLLFALAILLYFPFYMQSGAEKSAYLAQAYTQTSFLRNALAILALGQGAFYLFFIVIRLQKKPELYWQRIISWCIAGAYGIALTRFCFAFHFNGSVILPLTMTLLIYALGFAALLNPERLFSTLPLDAKGKTPVSSEKNKRLFQDLELLMQQERPYLKPQLSLPELALALQTNPQSLSQAINQEAGINFNDYLNAFRVRAFQELLNDSGLTHLTLDALAERAGFNSRSTFHAAFKKQTGTTPKGYKKSLICPE
jgi:AraC-like DNA-binding protein